MGIEPTQPAWKAGILPLNYTRTTNDILTYASAIVNRIITFFYVQNRQIYAGGTTARCAVCNKSAVKQYIFRQMRSHGLRILHCGTGNSLREPLWEQ